MFINRELSWLEFNHRVLQEGLADEVPLLERLKFLAIVSSNLDEFFMIRVAGLMQQRAAKIRRRDPAGMTPPSNLRPSASGHTAWSSEQSAGVREVLARLAEHGMHVLERRAVDRRSSGKFLRGLFRPARSCRC